jgi:hypothetical protein
LPSRTMILRLCACPGRLRGWRGESFKVLIRGLFRDNVRAMRPALFFESCIFPGTCIKYRYGHFGKQHS